MEALKTPLVLAALTLAVLVSGPSVDAAGTQPESKPAMLSIKFFAPAPLVIVKIGDAMLEEYHAGDLNRRTVILRQGDSAKQSFSLPAEKRLHS